MRLIVTAVVFITVIGGGALLYAWSGAYNIAATEPHWGITTKFIDLVKDRSIESHSGEIPVPDLDSAEMRRHAMPHYHGMCRYCHGAPGFSHSEFASGLYPYPPEMADGHFQEEWSDAELYWIVKHGIKMTGMPAFGPTHSEEQLWGLVALTRQIPGMTAEEYRFALQQVSGKEGHHGGGHHHSGQEEVADHGHGRETEPEMKGKGHHDGEEPEHGEPHRH